MPKGKRKSVMEVLAERVRELLDSLGPLLKSRQLQPTPVPVRKK